MEGRAEARPRKRAAIGRSPVLAPVLAPAGAPFRPQIGFGIERQRESQPASLGGALASAAAAPSQCARLPPQPRIGYPESGFFPNLRQPSRGEGDRLAHWLVRLRLAALGRWLRNIAA